MIIQNKKKIRIIAWFLALLGLDKPLEIIMKENENSFSYRNKTEKTLNFFVSSFNEIKEKKDIQNFTRNKYLTTIEDCISCGLEDMAILLANLKKPYPELIETYKVAAKHENMMYLKYIWEKAILYNKRIQKDSIETNTKELEKMLIKNMQILILVK